MKLERSVTKPELQPRTPAIGLQLQGIWVMDRVMTLKTYNIILFLVLSTLNNLWLCNGMRCLIVLILIFLLFSQSHIVPIYSNYIMMLCISSNLKHERRLWVVLTILKRLLAMQIKIEYKQRFYMGINILSICTTFCTLQFLGVPGANLLHWRSGCYIFLSFVWIIMDFINKLIKHLML